MCTGSSIWVVLLVVLVDGKGERTQLNQGTKKKKTHAKINTQQKPSHLYHYLLKAHTATFFRLCHESVS